MFSNIDERNRVLGLIASNAARVSALEKKRSMVSTFPDASDSSYDKRIQETRIIVEEHNVCQAVEDFRLLIEDLEKLKMAHNPTPCVEGACFGMWTPHRDRIKRRINVLKEEGEVYKSLCNRHGQ